MGIFTKMLERINRVDRMGFNPEQENYATKMQNVPFPDIVWDAIKKRTMEEHGKGLVGSSLAHTEDTKGLSKLNKEMVEKNIEHIKKGEMPGISSKALDYMKEVGTGENKQYYTKLKPGRYIDKEKGQYWDNFSENYYERDIATYNPRTDAVNKGRYDTTLERARQNTQARILNVIDDVPYSVFERAEYYGGVKDFLKQEDPELYEKYINK